jgi:hypothetical protein
MCNLIPGTSDNDTTLETPLLRKLSWWAFLLIRPR